jgi:hypothetical protein
VNIDLTGQSGEQLAATRASEAGELSFLLAPAPASVDEMSFLLAPAPAGVSDLGFLLALAPSAGGRKAQIEAGS